MKVYVTYTLTIVYLENDQWMASDIQEEVAHC